MQRRRTVLAQSLQVIGGGVALVARQTVQRVDRVPLFHAGDSGSFRKDRGGSDRNAAAVAFDQRFLLDQDIELEGVDEQVVRDDGELLQSRGHRLTTGLVDVPCVDAQGVYVRDGPGEGVFADAPSQCRAPVWRKLF